MYHPTRVSGSLSNASASASLPLKKRKLEEDEKTSALAAEKLSQSPPPPNKKLREVDSSDEENEVQEESDSSGGCEKEEEKYLKLIQTEDPDPKLINDVYDFVASEPSFVQTDINHSSPLIVFLDTHKDKIHAEELSIESPTLCALEKILSWTPLIEKVSITKWSPFNLDDEKDGKEAFFKLIALLAPLNNLKTLSLTDIPLSKNSEESFAKLQELKELALVSIKGIIPSRIEECPFPFPKDKPAPECRSLATLDIEKLKANNPILEKLIIAHSSFAQFVDLKSGREVHQYRPIANTKWYPVNFKAFTRPDPFAPQYLPMTPFFV